jgi:hypothetical protein
MKNFKQLLEQAEKDRGLPAGLLSSLVQQETGGNQKYITDPTTYHYGLNKEGKRIAGHTGKVSTAFGPFGILESTAADPGYGVKPLKDKSLQEQIRFAADYVVGRSKGAGGLKAGLAGYGEGDKYAKSVLGRIDGWKAGENPQAIPKEQQVPQQQYAVNEAPIAASRQPIERFGVGLDTKLAELGAMLNAQNQGVIPKDYSKPQEAKSDYENPFWKNFKELTGIL